MITLTNGKPMRFLLYKTHVAEFTAISLRNIFSDQEKAFVFEVTELYNAFRVDVADTDLTAMSGQNTLLVKNANGDTIYTEEVLISE